MEKEKTGIKENEINILDYLIIPVKRKKLIISITLSVAIITAIYSLTLPPIYRAETKILSPGQSGSGTTRQLLSEFGGLTGFVGGTPVMRKPEILLAIMKSRAVYDRIIDRFGLIKLYGAKRESLYKMLNGMVDGAIDKKSGVITVSIKNQDPNMAADMANAFIEGVKNRLQEFAITEASQRRLFFEEQLKHAHETLIKSEEALREFQEETGILNPDPLLPAGRIPAVSTDYIRKLRDMKYNEKLFEIMARQYEIAKVDEAKDAAIIQVMEKAIPPEKRFKPKRRQMVETATVIGFFLACLLAFFVEYYEKQTKDKEAMEKIETIKKYLLGDNIETLKKYLPLDKIDTLKKYLPFIRKK